MVGLSVSIMTKPRIGRYIAGISSSYYLPGSLLYYIGLSTGRILLFLYISIAGSRILSSENTTGIPRPSPIFRI